jgi:hypothetical protein
MFPATDNSVAKLERWFRRAVACKFAQALNVQSQELRKQGKERAVACSWLCSYGSANSAYHLLRVGVIEFHVEVIERMNLPVS